MEQTDLLRYVISILEHLSIRYAIVGSFASTAYGEPRFTQDIDIVVELEQSLALQLCAAFPADEFYVSESAVREAVEHSRPFNVIHPTSGNKVDFLVVSGDSWSRQQLARRRRETIVEGQEAYLAAPEDVILGKLVYFNEGGSEKHIRDITGILRVSGDIVDRDYVARLAETLNVADVWQAILERIGEA
jgi:hypothetical protein